VDKTEAGRAAVDRGARKREKTRQQVLDAAETCMTRGDGTFRIDDVAAVSGISPASIYSHFGSKDVLVSETVERLVATTEATLLSTYEAPLSDVARFEQIGVTFLDLLLEHPALARYLVTSGQHPPAPGAESEVAARLGRLRLGFEQAIQAVIDAGEMHEVDARLLSFSLLATWSGIALLGLRHDDLRLRPDEVRASLLQTIRIITEGLCPTPVVAVEHRRIGEQG